MDNNEQKPVSVVLCTVPAGSAHAIVRQILDRRLAACVNITKVRSLYSWEGSICDDAEELLVIKTTTEKFRELSEFIVSIHPYDLPEVIALPVADGYPPYLAWVSGEVG
ncbi:MAG: divalent-cation tolerance protein CutA [Methanospirillum sp.]|nr:divalent-cation tolerance protein CutA [Methanospirillum sp.]